jgi:hypothetical protein
MLSSESCLVLTVLLDVRSGIALTKESDIKALMSSMRRLEEQLTRSTAEVTQLRAEKLEGDACKDTLEARCSSLTTQLGNAAKLRSANELLEARLRSANAELVGLRLEKVCCGNPNVGGRLMDALAFAHVVLRYVYECEAHQGAFNKCCSEVSRGLRRVSRAENCELSCWLVCQLTAAHAQRCLRSNAVFWDMRAPSYCRDRFILSRCCCCCCCKMEAVCMVYGPYI